jgi:hypothetical protein
MLTYVIAAEDEFEETALNLLDIHDAQRVNPVFTDDTCVSGTRGETGCFRAHKNVWEMCAAQADDRCLVLERDWTIGDQDPAHVASELQSLPTGDDYYLVGNCGHGLCTHAYVIAKKHAAELSGVDECAHNMPVDAFMNKMCRDGSAACGVYEKETMPGCFGYGLIQQNRTDMIGMHDENNEMRERRDNMLLLL